MCIRDSFTGAWIEMTVALLVVTMRTVAPFTGAWIEMYGSTTDVILYVCRTLHGCVD